MVECNQTTTKLNPFRNYFYRREKRKRKQFIFGCKSGGHKMEMRKKRKTNKNEGIDLLYSVESIQLKC